MEDRWNCDPETCFCARPCKHPDSAIVPEGSVKSRQSVLGMPRRSSHLKINRIGTPRGLSPRGRPTSLTTVVVSPGQSRPPLRSSMARVEETYPHLMVDKRIKLSTPVEPDAEAPDTTDNTENYTPGEPIIPGPDHFVRLLSDDFSVDNMRMLEGEERENYVAEWIHHEVHRDIYRDVENREKFAHDFRASAMAEADSRDREEAEEQTNAALEAKNKQLNDLRQSFVFAGRNDWTCKRCGDIFSSMRLLGFHSCDFTRQTEAEVYNFSQLPAPSENDWRCQRCGEIFSSMTSISTHTCDFTQNVNVNQNVLINIQTGTGNTQTGEIGEEEEEEKWETEYNVDVPDLGGSGSDPEALGAANPSPDRNLTTPTPDRADRDTTQLQNENEKFQPRPRRFRLLQKHLRLSQAWKDRK